MAAPRTYLGELRDRAVRTSSRPETTAAVLLWGTNAKEAPPDERKGPLTCGGAKGTRTPNPLLANSARGRRYGPPVRGARREPAVAGARLTTRCSTSLQYIAGGGFSARAPSKFDGAKGSLREAGDNWGSLTDREPDVLSGRMLSNDDSGPALDTDEVRVAGSAFLIDGFSAAWCSQVFPRLA